MTIQQFTQSTNLGRFPSIETLNSKIKELKITDDDFIADLYGYYKIDTEPKYYIDYLNKDNGFREDRADFITYDDAKAFALDNFDTFNPDFIKAY